MVKAIIISKGDNIISSFEIGEKVLISGYDSQNKIYRCLRETDGMQQWVSIKDFEFIDLNQIYDDDIINNNLPTYENPPPPPPPRELIEGKKPMPLETQMIKEGEKPKPSIKEEDENANEMTIQNWLLWSLGILVFIALCILV